MENDLNCVLDLNLFYILNYYCFVFFFRNKDSSFIWKKCREKKRNKKIGKIENEMELKNEKSKYGRKVLEFCVFVCVRHWCFSQTK